MPRLQLRVFRVSFEQQPVFLQRLPVPVLRLEQASLHVCEALPVLVFGRGLKLLEQAARSVGIRRLLAQGGAIPRLDSSNSSPSMTTASEISTEPSSFASAASGHTG